MHRFLFFVCFFPLQHPPTNLIGHGLTKQNHINAIHGVLGIIFGPKLRGLKKAGSHGLQSLNRTKSANLRRLSNAWNMKNGRTRRKHDERVGFANSPKVLSTNISTGLGVKTLIFQKLNTH